MFGGLVPIYFSLIFGFDLTDTNAARRMSLLDLFEVIKKKRIVTTRPKTAIKKKIVT